MKADSTRICGFILAAGEGRRLRPLTAACPKALVPFCGIPLLELAAARLAELPLLGTVVNAWHHADAVAAAVNRLRTERAWPLHLSRESTLLDTGGGIRNGVRHLPDAEHILVTNADVILDFDLSSLLERHLESGADATLVLIPGQGPRTVDVDPNGNIANFRRPHGDGEYTFSGIHILKRAVLDLLPGKDVCSIIVAYENAIASGMTIAGLPVPPDTTWHDLGTIDRYIDAHGTVMAHPLKHHTSLDRAVADQRRRRHALEQAGVQCTGAIGIGQHVDIPQGSRLHDVVLWDAAALETPRCCARGVLQGGRSRLAPAVNERVPDPRIYNRLGVSPDACRTVPLCRRGSNRIYARITAEDSSWIWCCYGPERRENSVYACAAVFLRRLGVRAPQALLHLPDCGEILSHDLGSSDLLHLPADERLPFLRQTAAQVARLHVLGAQELRSAPLPLQAGFDSSLYDWERDYFRDHALGRILSRPELWEPLESSYRQNRAHLLAEPLVPIHRDLQSSNVMIEGGETYLIDFQGMRLGSAAYDLASLLYDPYTCYPNDVRSDIWQSYCSEVRELGAVPPDALLLHTAAIQRLMQALGAYGKLWLTDGLSSFRTHIVPGFRMLLEAAQHVPGAEPYQRVAESALSELDR